MGNKEEAEETLDKVKTFLQEKNYREARALTKAATKLYPKLKYGIETLMVCETLYFGYMTFPNFGIDWYSVLHLHPSSTDTEVNTHFTILVNCTTVMKEIELPGAIEALDLLNQAKSVLCYKLTRLDYTGRRKSYGFIDFPKTVNKTNFTDEYLRWKPPNFSVEMIEIDSLHSLKRIRNTCPTTTSMPSSPEREEGEIQESYPCLFPQIKKLKTQVFEEIPQRPHYAPLHKYGEEVREGAKIGFDIAFLNISKEIRRLDEPQKFAEKFDGFMEQLAQLEEMGYDVDKLRERLEILRRIVKVRETALDTIEMFKVEIKGHRNGIADRRLIIQGIESRISELEAENEETRILIDNHVAKIGVLKKDLMDASDEFTSTAKSTWK